MLLPRMSTLLASLVVLLSLWKPVISLAIARSDSKFLTFTLKRVEHQRSDIHPQIVCHYIFKSLLDDDHFIAFAMANQFWHSSLGKDDRCEIAQASCTCRVFDCSQFIGPQYLSPDCKCCLGILCSSFL